MTDKEEEKLNNRLAVIAAIVLFLHATLMIAASYGGILPMLRSVAP